MTKSLWMQVLSFLWEMGPNGSLGCKGCRLLVYCVTEEHMDMQAIVRRSTKNPRMTLSPFQCFSHMKLWDRVIVLQAHICANDYERVNAKSVEKRSPPPSEEECGPQWDSTLKWIDSVSRHYSPNFPYYLLPIICHTSVIIETHLWALFHLWRILRWWKTDLSCFGITLTVALSKSRQRRNCFNILSVSVCCWYTFVLQESSGLTDKRKKQKKVGTLTKTL